MKTKLMTLAVLGLFASNIHASGRVYEKIMQTFHEETSKAVGLTLQDIMSNNIGKVTQKIDTSGKNAMRLNKIKQVAFEYGANVGRAEQSRLYEQKAEKMAGVLDRDYDFNRLLIHQNPAVLPPIITEGFDNFKSIDRQTMQVSKHMMKIEVPAQIVTVVPTWRDYLKVSFTVDKHPNATFQPKTKKEKEIWDLSVQEGYKHGKRAADKNWENAWGELKRDYSSMLRYKIALANGDIDPAIIEVSDLGNVVDENGTISRQNEMMVRIVRDAAFSKKKQDANRKINPYPSYHKLPNGKRM